MLTLGTSSCDGRLLQRSDSKAVDGWVGFFNPVVVVQCTIAVALSPLLLLKLGEWVVSGSGGAGNGETCAGTGGIMTILEWAAAGLVRGVSV